MTETTIASSLIDRIKTREASICVLGLGYIGLPTASMFASKGFSVLGVDINEEILESLRNGKPHIKEAGLDDLVKGALDSCRLTVAGKPRPSDVFIIAVPTPLTEDKRADMRFVDAAAQSIIPHLAKGNLVILESTSPPRTTIDRLAPILEQSGLIAGEDFMLAYSPERVLPGKILEELIHNARIVGGVDQASSTACKLLYESFVEGDIEITDSVTAEMIKLMENSYRDLNIAFANELCRFAIENGADFWQARKCANMHPRVNILVPGVGVGGHCIPIDPWFLVEFDRERSKLVYQSRIINDEQPAFVLNKILEFLQHLSIHKLAVLGAT